MAALFSESDTVSRAKKKGCRGTLFRYLCSGLLAVALTELVDLLGGLQDVLLAGVKRVRLAGNLELQQRVLVAVFPLDSVAGRYRGLGQDGEIGRNILEHHVPVFWMNVLFHV